ncbi:MAG: hypothetical protein U0795_08045 [Pirellulales bacterium]
MITLEEREFGDAKKSQRWAVERETYWIDHHRASGFDLLNHTCFWKFEDRPKVPVGVRVAWERLYEILLRLDFHMSCSPTPPSGSFHHITRHEAYRGIVALTQEYPCLELGPLDAIANVRVDYEVRKAFRDERAQGGGDDDVPRSWWDR